MSRSLLEHRFNQESVLEFEDGEIVFNENDQSTEMYIISQGEVEIVKNLHHGPYVVAKLVRGDFFGEMSLLESLPRSATARAKGKTKLIAIQPGGFLLKIRRDPTFAFEMLKTLSNRIRNLNESVHQQYVRPQNNVQESTISKLLGIVDKK